jgi:hypothetical protein
MFQNEKMLRASVSNCNERLTQMNKSAELHEPWKNRLRFNFDSDGLDQLNLCIKNYENAVKIVKVEKMVYEAILNKTNKRIFPILLSKYDELMTHHFDINSDMVNAGGLDTQSYYDDCKTSMQTREMLKVFCEMAERFN